MEKKIEEQLSWLQADLKRFMDMSERIESLQSDIERWKEEYVALEILSRDTNAKYQELQEVNDYLNKTNTSLQIEIVSLKKRLTDTEQLLKDAVYSYEKVKGAFEELVKAHHPLEQIRGNRHINDTMKRIKYWRNKAGLTF